jgi:L-alanine-DL-glutamate epimerase-like enolase superfamily enzyme
MIRLAAQVQRIGTDANERYSITPIDEMAYRLEPSDNFWFADDPLGS